MVRLPLGGKIILYSSAFLVLLIVAMLVFVNAQADVFVDGQLTVDLERGRQRIDAAEKETLQSLVLTARLVASAPYLKAVLSTADLETVRDFLTSYQKENNNPDLLIVLDPQGVVVARTDVKELVPLENVQARWVRPALETESATGILVTSQGVYNAAATPAGAAGTIFGFVVAASRIDSSFAHSLRDLAHNEVVLVAERLLGSTLPEEQLPWRTRDAWSAALGTGRGHQTAQIAGENYRAATTLLGPEGPLRPLAVILQSRDRALEPYRRIQLGLVALGLVAALAGIGGSVLLARSVTAPVAKLVEGTEQVVLGNFDFRLDVRTGDEIGDLADSFNSMIRGLRERADMQKFVSQSTMDMIKADLREKALVGERKVLTILFSDMRGFTTMSENLPPEDVVKILNTCLSLQAERVKKYDGDIDKYVGDCVVALFSREASAREAIWCALDIHLALDEYNAALPEQQPILVGIGIVTGEVVLGSIGSRDRLDFTVIGSNVNLCARLCSMAGPGETLLAESTYRHVQDLVAAVYLEEQTVKGFSQPVPIYRVIHRGEVVSEDAPPPAGDAA